MEELTLADYLSILQRNKKIFFLTFAALFAVTVIFALNWSNYRSTATVEIEQSQISSDISSTSNGTTLSTPETLADLRIDKIKQKVTAPASLIEIITKFNLYPDARKYTPMDSIADRMSDKIRLSLISSEVANPAAAQKVSADQLSAIAFDLSFDYNDPQIARQVTDELVTRFLDEDLKQRRAQAQMTSDFLQTQITALEASMADQEKKIAEFQEANGSARPETLMFNQQAMSQTAFSIQNLDAQITANEGTQGNLRGQLTNIDPYSRVVANGQVMTTPRVQLKALEAQYATLTAQYGPDHPDVVKTRSQIQALKAEVHPQNKDNSKLSAQLKAEITDTKTNLETAKQTEGPENPDVQALTEKLNRLEAQLAKVPAASKDEKAQGEFVDDADNPSYLEFVAQLKTAQEQHKSLVAQRDALVQQQAKYQKAVAENPGLVQQMAALSRDYDNAQLRYRELKEKKMAADIFQQIENDQKGQRLLVINPPETPQKTHPSRLMILLGGLVLSVMGGLGMVILFQAANQCVLGPQHLANLLGVAPLVTVPYIITEHEVNIANHRRPYVIGGVLTFVLITTIVFSYKVMPLDVLFSVISQKLGMS